MKLADLLNKANEGYPDGFLSNFYNKKTGKPIKGQHGDGLAQFVVTELRETFTEDAKEEAQIQTAVEAINHAIRDLQATANALES